MRIFQEVTKEVTSLECTDILCNKCGKSCKGELGNMNGLIETIIVGAYDSTHLIDMINYEFSICEECLVEIFKTFKIKPHQMEGFV